MTNATFSRWTRYGHDRLYVEFNGDRLGYRDLKTGADFPNTEADRSLLTALINGYASHGEAERQAVAQAPLPTPSFDLSLNQAGQAAQARAAREWEQRKAERPIRALLGRVFDARTDERAWRLGALGERHVGAELAKVMAKEPLWTALHSIPVGDRGSDIDHLVIGPGGVLTLNAKHHPGASIWVGGDTFMVNGAREPYVRNARFEARRASRFLSAACGFTVPVTGLIVTVNAKNVTIKTPPDEKDGTIVHVVERYRLAKWLLRLRPVLSQDGMATIFDRARRPETWR